MHFSPQKSKLHVTGENKLPVVHAAEINRLKKLCSDILADDLHSVLPAENGRNTKGPAHLTCGTIPDLAINWALSVRARQTRKAPQKQDS